ncbi:SPX domain containing protein [Quillaja saponaria]|uniref:SPX domain containing protein n=1 Tax=Quillaja saponaria TaxID=32244 RepID=A0AAD7VG85_QUISA|nr:SPX domain containing protein [Quillaja saponaria]
MKFGKEFRTHLEETIPEWRDKFLCYKPLKKLLKHLPPNADDAALDLYLYRRTIVAESTSSEAVDGFNDFYVDKEEEFIIRLQELKERIERLKEKSSKSGLFTSESEFSEEMMDIRKDFVTIHGEMVLLKNFSSLNFAGLVKILKKYDKRTAGLLRLPFTQLVLHQPFFTTEPLTRLVRECEANLEVLFPLEAEVIESTSSTGAQSKSAPNNGTNSLQSSTSLGEETMDIYRETLAAMRAIRGLQKPSSTCNPLSFSALFRSQNDDGNGALTAENSAAHSSATLQDEEDADLEDAHSL